MPLPRDLDKIRARIEAIAAEAGLDFFPTFFELINYRQMNEIAAYEGFPSRYPHWRFGMEYERLSKSYTFGLHKIYELVINNNPCYAYLLEGNSLVDQKIVIAHVFAHCDFFKNNAWFSKTNRKMIDEMANHGARIRSYVEQHGVERVETFVDQCLSIENLIDPHLPFIVRERPPAEEKPAEELPRIQSKSYLDRYINPAEDLERRRQKLAEEREKARKLPPQPVKDVMGFVLQHAPLDKWEHNTLQMVREEAYYFAPQRQTKIMNEGWASFWHSRLMVTKIADASEIVDFADHHSGTVAQSPTSLNPYALGLALFRDIEERWNRGQFGKEYDACRDLDEKRRWNRRLGLGLQKIFEVRKIYNDITFLDEFMTEDFCARHNLYTFALNKRTTNYEIASRDFRKIKQQILSQLTNFGQPFIVVSDANYQNRGELLLEHRHEGSDLRRDYGEDTLRNLAALWRRPVNLATRVSDQARIWRHDGTKFQELPA